MQRIEVSEMNVKLDDETTKNAELPRAIHPTGKNYAATVDFSVFDACIEQHDSHVKSPALADAKQIEEIEQHESRTTFGAESAESNIASVGGLDDDFITAIDNGYAGDLNEMKNESSNAKNTTNSEENMPVTTHTDQGASQASHDIVTESVTTDLLSGSDDAAKEKVMDENKDSAANQSTNELNNIVISSVENEAIVGKHGNDSTTEHEINENESDKTKEPVNPEPSSIDNDNNQNKINHNNISNNTNSRESDLMEQVELLRIVLQTVCSEISATNSIPEEHSPLLLPIWMDVLSAQDLQLKLKSAIQSLAARPAIPNSFSVSSPLHGSVHGSVHGTHSSVHSGSLPPVHESTENYNSMVDWEELPAAAEGEEESPFGLESPVIGHLLSTWTVDDSKVHFLKSWIRSLRSPLSAGYPLGIQITNVSRVVRDGFVVLLVPIIRQMASLDPVRVLIRQHQITPHNTTGHNRRARHSSADSSDSALFSRSGGAGVSGGTGTDSRVIDFSDSDEENTAEEVDPFVSMESGTVFDIRIRRMASQVAEMEATERAKSFDYRHGQAHASNTNSSSHKNVHNNTAHHHHTAISRDGSEVYSPDSHFSELLNIHHKSHPASAGYRTDSHDYSSLTEISSVFNEMDRAVSKEIESVHPVMHTPEEPYNENKPLAATAAVQINTINSFFTSWFKGTGTGVAENSPSDGSNSSGNASNNASEKQTTDPSSVLPPTHPTRNEKAAADIIAASSKSGNGATVQNTTESSSSASNPTPAVARTNNAVQNKNKIAARLEAMRKK